MAIRKLEEELNKLSPEERSLQISKLKDKLRDNDLFMDRFVPDPAVEPAEDLTFFEDARERARQGKGPNPLAPLNPEFLQTAWRNLPFSGAELGRETEGLVRDLPSVLKALAGIVLDLPTAATDALGIREPEQVAQSRGAPSAGRTGENRAVEFGRALAKSVTDPREVARHPLGALATVAAPVAGRSRALAAAADPLATGIGLLAKGGKAAAKKARIPAAAAKTVDFGGKIAAELFGATSGKGGENVLGNVESGASSARRAGVARKQLREGTRKDIGTDTIEAIEKKLEDLTKVKNKALKDSKDQLLDTADIRREIMGDIDKAGEGGLFVEDDIRATVGRAASKKGAVEFDGDLVELEFSHIPSKSDRKTIKKMLADIGEGPARMSPVTLDDVKLGIDDVIKSLKSDRAVRIATRIRQKIRAKLDEVEGYSEPVSEMSDLFDVLDEHQEELGARLRREGKKKPGGTRVAKALGKGFVDEGDAIRDVVTDLDLRFEGLDLQDRLPAQAMSRLAPSSLVGRAEGASAVRSALTVAMTGGAGAAAGGPIGGLIGSVLGVMSVLPRVVGRAAIEFGATTRQAQKAADFARDIGDKAKAAGINTSNMTFGQVIQRTLNLEESEQPKRQLLRNLNRIDLSPPVR
jgi:hypothetical protein